MSQLLPKPDRLLNRTALLLALVAVSCSSSHSSPEKSEADAGGGSDAAVADSGADAGGDAGGEAGSPTPVVETGTMLDFITRAPVAGLTVTDNGISSTTDSNGAYSITLPAGFTVSSPTITGPGYGLQMFPEVLPSTSAITLGPNVIPDLQTFALLEQALGLKTSQAIVAIAVHLAGSCTSQVGGSVQILSPAGASLAYFSPSGLPDNSLTTFQDVGLPRPVAVAFNIPPGQQLKVSATHPTCKVPAFPVESQGGILNGEVPTMAASPQNAFSAIAIVLE